MAVIKIIGFASGFSSQYDGSHVKTYDVNGNNGRGFVSVTSNPNDAIAFTDVTKAYDFWCQQSKKVPFRPDGNPNKPLTVFNVLFEPI